MKNVKAGFFAVGQTGITNDYNMFRSALGNRAVLYKHVKRLADSMKERGFDTTKKILVSRTLEVLDGQHRLEAARLAGVSVHYEVVDQTSIYEMHSINAIQRKWKLEDYLNAYSDHGDKYYIKLKEFVSSEPVSLIAALSVVSGVFNRVRGGVLESFYKGEFEYTKESYDLLVAYTGVVKAINLATGQKMGNTPIIVLFRLLNEGKVKADRLLAKISSAPLMWKKTTNTKHFLEMLNAVYNFRSKLSGIVELV